jgi:hypothetical protein
VVYKKVCRDFILKLEIPAEAKRTASLIGNKCRAEFAKVIGWKALGNPEFLTEPKEFYSKHDNLFIYQMGATVKPDNYNPNIRLECTQGIHFFINLKDAENYTG